MRLAARPSRALWREIVTAAVYLYNRTPKENISWKSPYQALHEWLNPREGVTGPTKPQLHHLRSYGCKCFVLIKSKGDPDYPPKLQKLAPRAHIGYLAGYDSTSIYRVWIPHKVILARDILFNEDEFLDGKPTRMTLDLMQALDEAVELVEEINPVREAESLYDGPMVIIDNTNFDSHDTIEKTHLSTVKMIPMEMT